MNKSSGDLVMGYMVKQVTCFVLPYLVKDLEK